ncbi:hypothetical protein V6N13_068443 [Hibiscus sabdariffa]
MSGNSTGEQPSQSQRRIGWMSFDVKIRSHFKSSTSGKATIEKGKTILQHRAYTSSSNISQMQLNKMTLTTRAEAQGKISC